MNSRNWKIAALGSALFIGGCAANPPTAQADKDTTVITSPSKPAADHHAGGDMAHGSTVHTHTTRLRVTSAPAAIEAGKSATLTLQIVDNADSAPINDYEVVHDEKLHLILVSNDLSWFSHLHPKFIGDGKFNITTTFPSGGNFRLYADYKPQGEEGEVALHEFHVKGADALPTEPKLVADKIQKMWMVKPTRSALEGQAPAANAPSYQVALMPMPEKIVAGEDVMLHFQVRDTNGKPLQKLQPYLGAMGHCVILDADPKTYLHSHPMDSAATTTGDEKHAHGDDHAHAGSTPGADVMFHSNFPHAGLYKVWGQFKHDDKIITAPFVVQVAAAKSTPKVKPAAVVIPANAQKITVELPAGYKKGAAVVKAGTPVAITFKLTKDAGCGNAIAVPAANWKQNLKVGESATVVYTPQKSGELKFACSMDMYQGTLTVK